MKPRTDVAFVTNFVDDNSDDSTLRDPVAFLEFGISERHKDSVVDLWFGNFGQGMKYVELMINPKILHGQKRKRVNDLSSEESYGEEKVETEVEESFGVLRMTKPMLFYTVVYSEGEEDSEDETQRSEDEETNDSGDYTNLSMMIGCFLCQPKDPNVKGGARARVALMYRHHVNGADNITNFLCAMLQEIIWFKKITRDEEFDEANWMYLGPHCAVVTNSCGTKEVYRAYDSRPWPIARSSAMYGTNALNTALRTVILHSDAPGTTGQGADGDASIESTAVAADQKRSTYSLFEGCGEVEVIAIPFIPGSHVPKNVAQALAVAQHLKRIHSQGLVHGDLRLLNMVFGDENSELIDFDFGGTAGVVKYPPGYRPALADGSRPYGQAGDTITKSHDVHGLVLALQLVLNPFDDAWRATMLSSDPCIDDVVGILQRLVDNGTQPLMGQYVRKFLEDHTKLALRSTKTREGDPKSPAKGD